MKRLYLLTLAVVLTPALAAQDSTKQTERERLRAQIEQRFAERLQHDLKLSADQTTKLRATQERFGARRRALAQQQMERRRALENQMQPGFAANADSVRKLMDEIRSGRAEMLKIERDEDQEMAEYLNPVQRARFQQMRERFMHRLGEMRELRRQREQMPRRPGMRPAPRMRRRGI